MTKVDFFLARITTINDDTFVFHSQFNFLFIYLQAKIVHSSTMRAAMMMRKFIGDQKCRAFVSICQQQDWVNGHRVFTAR